MTSPLDTIVYSVIYFCAAVFIHLFICRKTGERRYMLKGLGTGGLLCVIILIKQLYCGKINILQLYFVGTLWLAYMMFFINLLNSVTLKMLSFLYHKGGAVNTDAFCEIFGKNNSLLQRIKAIIANDFVTEVDKKLIITKRGAILLRIIRFLRKLIGITEIG